MMLETELERAILKLLSKITAEIKADDALKFTQAALNLAHVLATIENNKK